jgi:hypothetical protein
MNLTAAGMLFHVGNSSALLSALKITSIKIWKGIYWLKTQFWPFPNLQWDPDIWNSPIRLWWSLFSLWYLHLSCLKFLWASSSCECNLCAMSDRVSSPSFRSCDATAAPQLCSTTKSRKLHVNWLTQLSWKQNVQPITTCSVSINLQLYGLWWAA